MKTLIALVMVLALLGAAGAGESAPPTFTKKPTATKASDKATIHFAADRETDVAVFIEDAQGKIVRHLVAGVLGKNAPAPLKAGSLEQTVEWDGLADYGKPAGAGPFKVRVALGLSARYDKVIVSDTQSLTGIASLVAGADGTVYVLHGTGGSMSGSEAGGGSTLRAFNRDGTYARTVIPFPSNLPAEKVKTVAPMTLNGRPAPVNSQIFGGLYPGGGTPRKAGMGITPDGVVLRVLNAGNLAAVDGKTGAIPWDSYTGPALPGTPGQKSCVVAAPDGKSAYLGGLAKPAAVVYRIKLPERTAAGILFGDAAKAGADDTHLGAVGATGLAVDGNGNLLISDHDNNRVIAVSEKDGKLAGTFAVKNPESIGVNPATGAIYVIADGGKNLIKFSGWKDAKELARLPLDSGGNGTCMMTLDAGGKQPIVWVGTDGAHLYRIEDADNKLTAKDINSNTLGNAAFLDLTVDRFRPEHEIYVRSGGGGSNYFRINDATGNVENFRLEHPGAGFSGVNILPAPDGHLYGLGWPLYFLKHDHKGKSLAWEQPNHKPMPASDGFSGKWDATLSYVPVSMGSQPHTIGARGTDGHIFVMEPAAPGGRPAKMMREYLPTGKLVSEDPIVWKVSEAALGPRFDAAGNIYIADIVRPMDWPYPPEFNQVFKSPIEINKSRPEGAQDAIGFSYGSIVKFSPKGGIIDYQAGSDHSGQTITPPFKGEPKLDPSLKKTDVAWYGGRMLHGPEKIIGAEWVHPGVSHIGVFYCNCENVTFDVDEFGRSFFPDADLFQIHVIDTAGNSLLNFGGYGNADSCGTESKDTALAQPEIAFARVVSVGVTDKYAYCGDSMNRRLLRLKFVYAADERSEIR